MISSSSTTPSASYSWQPPQPSSPDSSSFVCPVNIRPWQAPPTKKRSMYALGGYSSRPQLQNAWSLARIQCSSGENESISSGWTKKCEKGKEEVRRQFSIDPSITNFIILRQTIAAAFQLTHSSFVINYLVEEEDRGWSIGGGDRSRSRYIPMLSEWDYNAAVEADRQQRNNRQQQHSSSSSSTPQLHLRVDVKPFYSQQGWDIIDGTEEDIVDENDKDADVVENRKEDEVGAACSLLVDEGVEEDIEDHQSRPSPSSQFAYLDSSDSSEKNRTLIHRLSKGAYHQIHKLVSFRSRSSVAQVPFRKLLAELEDGVLEDESQLRLYIYHNGVDPELRPRVWPHLLNVYPPKYTHEQRTSYIAQLSAKYQSFKECWEKELRSVVGNETVRLVANAVVKDVLRTDRCESFYGGNEDNPNILSLFNILTTYALTHPSVSYCQGMSDLASPLLYVLKDEAMAYICFCALMKRLRYNFMCDGKSMTQKFHDLHELLQHQDPVLYEYLAEAKATDLLFCYRWLLLELKREFTFRDALSIAEIMWASLPADYPDEDFGLSVCQMDITQHQQQSPSASNSPSTFVIPPDHVEIVDPTPPPAPPPPPPPPPVTNPEVDNIDGREESADEFNYDCHGDHDHCHDADGDVESGGTSQKQPQHGGTPSTITRNSSAGLVCQSCPGTSSNGIGMCHESLIRTLVMGKSSDTQLHSYRNFKRISSYPPIQGSELIRRLEAYQTGPKEHSETSQSWSPSNQTETGENEEGHKSPETPKSVSSVNNNNDGLLQMDYEWWKDGHKTTGNMTGSNCSGSNVVVLRPSTETKVADFVDHQDWQDKKREGGGGYDKDGNSGMGRLTIDVSHPTVPSSSSSSSGAINHHLHHLPTPPKLNLTFSPIPVGIEAGMANDSTDDIEDDGKAMDISLREILDICSHSTSQSYSSYHRSRQTSGDPHTTVTISSDTKLKLPDDTSLKYPTKSILLRQHSENMNDDNRNYESSDHVSQFLIYYDKYVVQGYGSGVSSSGGGQASSSNNNSNNHKTPIVPSAADSTITSSAAGGLGSVGSRLSALNRIKENEPSDFHSSFRSIGVEDGELLLMDRVECALLPPPHQFGQGNPFMLFLAVSLLMQHRGKIMGGQMDFNEIAIYFDKLARQHSAAQILKRARSMYKRYLIQWYDEDDG